MTVVMVRFLRQRPKGKLRLVVTLNNEDHTVEVEKDNLVQWSGSL